MAERVETQPQNSADFRPIWRGVTTAHQRAGHNGTLWRTLAHIRKGTIMTHWIIGIVGMIVVVVALCAIVAIFDRRDVGSDGPGA